MNLPGNVDLRVVDYDPKLIQVLADFSDDYEGEFDEKIASVVDQDIAVKTWKAAKRWVNSGAAWGMSIPGVAVDCVGSAIALPIEVGIVEIPSALKQRASSARNRAGELACEPGVLNKRLQAFLMSVLMKCTKPGYLLIPVKNPVEIYPLDIFITPYTWAVNGQVMLPHAMICARANKFLTANQEIGSLQFVDVEQGRDITVGMELPGKEQIAGFALRFFRSEPDTLYHYHKQRVLSVARAYNKRLGTFLDD